MAITSINGQTNEIVELNASDIPVLDANNVLNGNDVETVLEQLAIMIGNLSDLQTIDKTSLVDSINELRSVLPVEAVSFKGKCDSTGTIITLTWQNAYTPSYRAREIYVSTEDITTKDREWCDKNAILIDRAVGSGRNNIDSIQYTGVLNAGYYFKIFTRYRVGIDDIYGRGVALYIEAKPYANDQGSFDYSVIGNLADLVSDIINAGAGDSLVEAINYVYNNAKGTGDTSMIGDLSRLVADIINAGAGNTLVEAINYVYNNAKLDLGFCIYEAENFTANYNLSSLQINLSWKNANFDGFTRSEVYISEADLTNLNRTWCLNNATKIYQSTVRNYDETVQYNADRDKVYYLKIFTIMGNYTSRGVTAKVNAGSSYNDENVTESILETLKREIRLR